MKTAFGQIAAMGAIVVAALLAAPVAHAGKTLDGIRARGQVVCGVNTGLAGFAMADSSGKWSGLDVDVCRALAAAVLGDGQKVKYVPLDVPQRFTALQSGEVDVLSRNTTFSLARDASMGLHQTVVDGDEPLGRGAENGRTLMAGQSREGRGIAAPQAGVEMAMVSARRQLG